MEWSNWLTPPIVGDRHRFDTLFYLLRLPGQMRARLCDRELAGAQVPSLRFAYAEGPCRRSCFEWVSVEEAVYRDRQNNPLQLHPPQV